MVRLTKAQVIALYALPVEIITWGGKPFGGMPDGVKSRTTLASLRSKGLASCTVSGTREKWVRTPAGRQALEAHHEG